MWKWIVGALLVLVVAVAAFCYVAVKKITSGGDTVTVAIAAMPEQVFAAMADPDSMETWMISGSTVSASHRGVVAVGDTLHVESGKAGRGHQQFTWIVSAVKPSQLLVLEMRDSTGLTAFATRRDSLVTSGDSTLVVSTIASPMMDSIKTERGDTGGKVGGALLNFANKMLVSSFRLVSERELRQLKAHLEAKPKAAKP